MFPLLYLVVSLIGVLVGAFFYVRFIPTRLKTKKEMPYTLLFGVLLIVILAFLVFYQRMLFYEFVNLITLFFVSIYVSYFYISTFIKKETHESDIIKEMQFHLKQRTLKYKVVHVLYLMNTLILLFLLYQLSNSFFYLVFPFIVSVVSVHIWLLLGWYHMNEIEIKRKKIISHSIQLLY